MLRRHWWVVVSLVLTLSGCLLVDRSQQGKDVDPLRLALVERGRSTRADVLKILGTPSRESVLQDREAWVYDFSQEENRVTFLLLYTEKRKTKQQRSLAVLFADEVVYDYMFLD